MDATSRSRARRSRRDSIAIDRRERDTIDHAVGRSSIVGAHARPRSDRIESIRSRSRSIARSRSNERVRESERRRAYLGDDGGARGDAFLRARGSRRERDQSGVQRQGDHDCVCVTPVVQPSRACVRAFGRGRGERHRYMGQDSSKSPPPPSRRNPIHFDANPSTRRGLVCIGSMIVYVDV